MELAVTNAELAELRGEIYGCKILLANCVAFIAGLTDDPSAHLETLQQAVFEGIATATNEHVRPQHLNQFRAAAAGIVLQAVEGAKSACQLSTPQGQA
jgi:hypothetical protein